jgi:DNA-binding MarR family transcriptional regulator
MIPGFIERVAEANAALSKYDNTSVVNYCILLLLMERGPMNQQAVADHLRIGKSSMSHFVRRMTGRGLLHQLRTGADVDGCRALDGDERRAVLRCMAGTNRRSVVLYPGPAGKRLVADVERALDLRQRQAAADAGAGRPGKGRPGSRARRDLPAPRASTAH